LCGYTEARAREKEEEEEEGAGKKFSWALSPLVPLFFASLSAGERVQNLHVSKK
jgi:hypothetical protein